MPNNKLVEKIVVRSFVGFFICFALVFVFAFLSALFPGRIGATAGTHTGVITAVEYNSNFIWEANLVYFKTVRESSQEDVYCVNDELLMAKLIEYQKNKKEVTLHFQNDFVMWNWECNGGLSIITAVE
ncbi:MAG: hypothetical protein KBB55_03570 [Candidatus Buchananbacteria bacterium]|nr:hypothetical protein [Candidatus Buchananbacteria bacterium]